MRLQRLLLYEVRNALKQFPVVGLVGSRQVGKTTLAREFASSRSSAAVYLDLELPSDRAKLADPEAFLEAQAGALVILDEIQKIPRLFETLRSLVDRDRRAGRFLILGSASPDVLRQGSESLAGRIRYLQMNPLVFQEVNAAEASGPVDFRRHWWRGGYPDSFLAPDDESSCAWRRAFVETFLERDIPQWGLRVPATRVRRFWEMLAHLQGQPWNASKLAGSLDMTGPTARHYLDILTDTLLVRQLQPLHANVKKRLVKAPRVYLRDAGLLHSLLRIDSPDDLWGHPSLGASFEGYVIEQVLATVAQDADATFYRTAVGLELDLVLARGSRRVAIEIKHTSSPRPERRFMEAMHDVGATQGYVVAPVREAFDLGPGVKALPVHEITSIEI